MNNKAFVAASATRPVTLADALTMNKAQAGSEFCVGSTYTISAEQENADGFLPLLAIPAGARLTQLDVTVPDMDTDGTPAITIHLGVADNTDLFVASSTAGQAGGTISMVNTDRFTRFDVDTLVGIEVAVDADAGVTSGTIRALARFIYDPA